MAARRIIFALLMAAGIFVVIASGFSSTAHSRTLTDCVAVAYTPTVNATYRTGHAVGGANGCTGTTTYWQGHLKLVNNAGNILQNDFIAADGSWIFDGTETGCAGAIVHTSTYVNDDGHGSSDESGTNSNCAY